MQRNAKLSLTLKGKKYIIYLYKEIQRKEVADLNVARYRKISGYTQAELAERLNISRQAFSEKERGKIPFKEIEMRELKLLFEKNSPSVTIDEIFFS